jgi:hypothetical protein
MIWANQCPWHLDQIARLPLIRLPLGSCARHQDPDPEPRAQEVLLAVTDPIDHVCRIAGTAQ